MMGFTPTFYAGRPKLSEITIDSDLDMGGRTVIAAKGRFAEVNLDKAVVTDTLLLPYTVTPSDNVYYTSNISVASFSTSFSPISGSIVIGPTSVPISPRLYVDVEFRNLNRWVELRVYKNSDLIGTIRAECYSDDTTFVTKDIDLPDLVGGDVLNFTARANQEFPNVTIRNFRLAGDVVKYIIDEPTAETVYD